MNTKIKKAFNLQRTFAVLALVAISVISTVSGVVLYRYLSQHMLERDMIISSEFIQSVAQINDPEPFFQGVLKVKGNPQIEEFFHHITKIPDVLRATVYDTTETIIWSDNKELVGMRFADNDELIQALSGTPVFARESKDDRDNLKTEHRFLPDDVSDFVESYLPMWDHNHKNVIGVLELYKAPNALFKALEHGKILVLTITLLGGGLLYLILYWVVRRASQTIDSQAGELKSQINQLSELLKQNQELRNRTQQASSRAVELNEQFLRRVGSELHDGPAQSLGFALLRLDAIKNYNEVADIENSSNEFEQIKSSLSEALTEIRSLSAGLVMPELTQLSLKELLTKVVRSHENRTENHVSFFMSNLPENCPLPLKICAYRFAQEGLNNAFRHARGSGLSFSAKNQDMNLELTITDKGVGFDLNNFKSSKHSGLGLLGLRERIESLGGEFSVQSAPGEGTRINAKMPLNSGVTEDDRYL